MKTIFKYYLVSLIGFFPVLLTAEETSLSGCGDKYTIEVEGKGALNEKELRAQIDKTEEEIRMLPRHGRGSYLLRRMTFENELRELNTAMQELFDLAYADGCKEAIRGASMDVRLKVIEKRLDVLEKK